uniref:Uncharacterized protein n=1 Tax=Pundamilia nyererei TaxID=303518 RepID=A0A3B4GX30_9CICH
MQAAGDFLNVFNTETSKISVTLFLIFLGLLYWYSVHPFSVLSRCGIKHPKPVPFFGNLFMFQQGFFKPLNDLVKTYGKWPLHSFPAVNHGLGLEVLILIHAALYSATNRSSANWKSSPNEAKTLR